MIFKYNDMVKFVGNGGIMGVGKVVRVDHEKHTVDVQPVDTTNIYTVNAEDVVLDYDSMSKKEDVYCDKHYSELDVQPMDVISEWPIQQQIGFFRGNLLKYTMRLGKKDVGVKESAKILRYAQWLHQVMKGETVNPRE